MHVLIVDDEPLARMRLRRMLEAMTLISRVDEAQNGEESIAAILEIDPDVVMMDVRMPGKDGLKAAREISELEDPPALIFCTAYDEYALEAFETLAAGYLLKPVSEAKLQAAIEKASKTNKIQKSTLVPGTDSGNSRNYIASTSHKGTELIPLSSIFCFVADNKYITVIHEKGESIIDETLKDLESDFGTRFVRVHRNALVATTAIDGLEKNSDGHTSIRFKSCEHVVQVSRRHLTGLKSLLSSL